jgi:hypothetical protein
MCCFPCPTASQADPVLEHLRVSGYLILGGTAHKMSMHVNTSCLFSAPSGSFRSPCVHESLRGSQVEMPLCPQVVYLPWGNHSFISQLFLLLLQSSMPVLSPGDWENKISGAHSLSGKRSPFVLVFWSELSTEEMNTEGQDQKPNRGLLGSSSETAHTPCALVFHPWVCHPGPSCSSHWWGLWLSQYVCNGLGPGDLWGCGRGVQPGGTGLAGPFSENSVQVVDAGDLQEHGLTQ